MQLPQSAMAPPQAIISQTPRLKAKNLSPMLGPFDLDNNAKRAISVLDQDYDLMGLSQKQACEEDSFLIGDPHSLAAFEDDLKLENQEKQAKEQLPVYMSTINNGFDCKEDFLLDPVDEPVPDLSIPDANFGLRNRSLTFHYPSNSLNCDLFLN